MNNSALRLVLASASPRRLQLLHLLDLDPLVHPPNILEIPADGEPPRAFVRRLAEAKGRQVAATIGGNGTIVIAADTVVVLDERPLGKPRDAVHAAEMLRALRGRTHHVITGVFLVRTDDGRSFCQAEETRVQFEDYDDETIERYVATGEPLDKAGSYGIQGAGAQLVRGVTGSWTNVVGLPCERIRPWMARIGVDIDRVRTK